MLLETGVIEKDVFSLLVIIMFGYILLMPPIIAAAVGRAKPPELASQPGPWCRHLPGTHWRA